MSRQLQSVRVVAESVMRLRTAASAAGVMCAAFVRVCACVCACVCVCVIVRDFVCVCVQLWDEGNPYRIRMDNGQSEQEGAKAKKKRCELKCLYMGGINPPGWVGKAIGWSECTSTA
jgi:hypothetical protein